MAVVAVCTMQAQDIIETADAGRIEAKVTEISKTEIRYKEFTNLEGPVFVLPVTDVKSVTFSNGQVKLFNRPAAANAPLTTDSATQVVVVKKTQSATEEAMFSGPIEKIDDIYYIGGTRLSQGAYEAFLRKNCPEAYASLMRGKRTYRAGWGLLGTGIGLTAIGLGCAIAGISQGAYVSEPYYNSNWNSINTDYYIDYNPAFSAGLVLCAFGEAFGIASIPCLIVGGIKKNNAHEVYNTACSQRRTALNLQLQTSGNGLGLALCF